MTGLRGRSPAVRFDLDGDEYALRFGVDAMVRYQEAMGETALEAFTALDASPGDFRRIRALFWCALTPSVPLERVGEVMDGIGLGAAADLMRRAATAAFPGAEAEGAAESRPDQSAGGLANSRSAEARAHPPDPRVTPPEGGAG